jgi:hypothetical protein
MAKGSEIFRGVLEAARKQLLLDFDASKGFAHSGIKGEERAEALAAFLKSRLPPAFGITTGEVIDSGDRRTGQLDLIIYDQTVTQPVHAGRKNELYPCEAVYAVIEVKSLLSRAEMEICVKAAQKLRRLRPFRERFVDSRTMGTHADRGAHRCMYIIFAFATDLSEADWPQAEYDRLLEVAAKQETPLSYIDRLMVLDRGLINPMKGQGKTADGDPITLFAEFFLHLVNFLERERNRRPVLSWQHYALPHSRGWRTLTRKQKTHKTDAAAQAPLQKSIRRRAMAPESAKR